MLPNAFLYQLPAGNATSLASTTPTTTALPIALQTNDLPGLYQRRVVVTSGSNDSGIYFYITGLNQANMSISEFLVGGNATFAQSNLDYTVVTTVAPSSSSTQYIATATAGTVSVGVNGVGSSMWVITNTHVSPVNIEYGCVLQLNGATYSIQYTYDDPNNLFPGVTFPQPFNHPVIVNATTSMDGSSNDPIFAWRLLVSAGTGTLRITGIQAGIAGP